MTRHLILLLIFSFLSCKEAAQDVRDTSLTPPKTKQEESISRGKEIYANHCASCHLSKGQGIPGVFPPLNNSNWLTEKRAETIHAVKFGLNKPIIVNEEEYDNIMPQTGLNDTQIADVLNYIFNTWDNSIAPPVTVKEVTAIEK